MATTSKNQDNNNRKEGISILLVTQVLDRSHSVLGFFHAWVEEFARQCEGVTVLCLMKGEYRLPSNVRVLSLGKEGGVSRTQYLKRFFAYVLKERKYYDAVLVHMNPEYIILGGILWRILRKPIGLWYVHKHIGLRLRLATLFTNYVFTVSPESFRLKSTKVKILGHGIDASFFTPGTTRGARDKKRILMLGRISPSKRIDVGIELIGLLSKEGKPFELLIVGEPTRAGDEEYLHSLQERVQKRVLVHSVHFTRGVSHEDTKTYYQNADVFLHTSETGSVDKVVLEALASGLPVVSTSEAFEHMPGVKYVYPGDIDGLVRAIVEGASEGENTTGIQYVRKNHALSARVTQMLGYLKK